MSSFSRVIALVALVVGVSIAAGCAEERAPVNRVQAQALPKSFFVGPKLDDPADDPEFYMRTTLVDVAAGAGTDGLFTSSDAQPTARVRWEITEKNLYARLTYELIKDSDFKGTRPTPDGQVVAAFTIEKHFDIRRKYNESTGEEENVVDENDTDRPWFQRDYMRVDWSKNLVTDAYDLDAASQLGMYGVKWDPISYTVNDDSNPDKPLFDIKGGYFDVTNKAYAAPQIIHDEEYGDFPACYLVGEYPATSCNTSEVTMRLSFKKVEDHDFEVTEYDGRKMEVAGWFTVDRFGYDRKYGIVDDKWHRFAARWNIWEHSHAQPVVPCASPLTTPVGLDPRRDDDHDGTDDECKSVGRGSRCDVFRGECTMPLRDRKIKTIPWYVNQGYPEDLFDAAKQALDAWSNSIRVAMISGRLAECRRTKEQGCEAQMGWPERWSDDYQPPFGADAPSKVPAVFALCHNPSDKAKDDPVCGDTVSPRLGDLRYNFITMIASPQVQRPWGIMVDAEDPMTGEKVSGSVNQWSSTLDRAAATLVDLLSLLNGETKPDQFIAGQNTSAWVRDNRPGSPGNRAQPMSADELQARLSSFDPQVVGRLTAGISTADKKKPAPLRHKLRAQALTDAHRLGPGNSALSGNLHVLKGSRVEAQMVTPEMVQAVGLDPTAAVTVDAIKRGSPFGRMNPTVRRDLTRAKRVARAKKHSCLYEGPEPDNLIGMAKLAAQLFPAPDPNDFGAIAKHRDDVYQWARKQYAMSVFAHEIGHSMGLRHNFAASFDSLNYKPEYWQLRTKNGEITQACAAGTTDGASCIGPRYKDPVAQYEIDGNIGRFGTTSVMDYPGDQNHDQLNIGSYDRAAMRLGYGGVVDVWNQPGVSVKGGGAGQDQAYKLTAFTTSPGIFGIFYFPPLNPADDYRYIHYSQYQKEFGLINDCAADGSPDAVLGKKCKGAPMDVVPYDDMKTFVAFPDYAQYDWAQSPRAVDDQGRVRRGYMFSSDEYADSGNVPSFTYDAGADAYEQIRFLESQYENRYILDAFRRNRVQFDSYDVTSRIQAHYLDAIQQIAKSFAFGAALDGDPATPSAALLADGNYGPLGVGSSVALELFARTLMRPDPGFYCNADDCGSGAPYGVDTPLFIVDSAPVGASYAFDVPLGTGRFLHNDFDYSKGYWWSDYQKQVGAFYEKTFATYYLSEAFDTFISNSKEDFVDSRYKNVSFATVYPDQIRRLFANLLTGDYESYAPWTVTSGNGIPEAALTYPQWFNAKSWGTRPAGAKIVDPNWGFNEQLYMMVWGNVFFPTNWSMQWIDDARITALGSDQIAWTPAETYTYYDPASGITYRSHAVGTESVFGITHQKGVGARMLEFGNKLVGIAYQVELDNAGNPVLNANGTPKLLLDANGHPQKDPNFPGADLVVQKFADQIAIMRQLTSTFARDTSDLPGK